MRKNEFVMSYSDLFRVSIDPRVKPEGDRKECVIEGDRKECGIEGDRKESGIEGDRKESVAKGGKRWKNVPECDNFFKVMPRFGTNCHGIFELEKNKIGRSLDLAYRLGGMTVLNEYANEG